MSNPATGTSDVRAANPKYLPMSMDLSNHWQVTFKGTAMRRQIDWLSSWTVSADTRMFSGEAVYRKTIHLQPRMLSARHVVLSFGEARPLPRSTATKEMRNPAQARLDPPVREAAVVVLNGMAGRTLATTLRIGRVEVLATRRKPARDPRLQPGAKPDGRPSPARQQRTRRELRHAFRTNLSVRKHACSCRPIRTGNHHRNRAGQIAKRSPAAKLISNGVSAVIFT
jgi:hypothetical protein